MSQNDAIGDFIALPRDQQLATLEALSPGKQDQLLAAVKVRRSIQPYKGPAPLKGSPVGRFVSSAIEPIKGAVQGMVDANPTPAEKQQGLTSSYDFWMRPLERVVEAQTGQVDEARDLAKQGRYSEAAGHALASAVPLLGPWVADAAQQFYGQLGSGDTAGAVGTAAGNIALAFAPEAAGKVKELAPRAASATGDLAMRPVRAVTGTGPRAVRDLVKDTTKAREGVDRTNAQLATDRAAEVRSHFDKTQSARAEAERRSGIASRKAALESGVRKLSDKFQDDLKETQRRVKTQADEKYNTVRDALGPKKDPVTGEPIPETEAKVPSSELAKAVRDAGAELQGSSENLKVFRDILRKHPESDPDFVEYQGAQIPKGHPLYEVLTEGDQGTGVTFSDLQGYYSELGDRLSSGNLLGDVYQATKALHESIGTLMQKMAKDAGVGPQLADAQSFYRGYAETFRNPHSPLYKAIKAKEPGAAVRQLLGKDRTAIEALAKYNPELARRANVLRSYQDAASTTRAPAASTKPAPQLAPRREPAPYPQIGPEDVRAAKAESLAQRARFVRHRGSWAATWPLLYVLRDIIHGNVAQIPGALGESAITLAGVHGLANLMESKPVVEFLTKATPRDVAQIPPDLRSTLPQIVRRARAQGIKVSPALTLAFRGAAALAPRHEQNATDAWAIGRQ